MISMVSPRLRVTSQLLTVNVGNTNLFVEVAPVGMAEDIAVS